jgi:hypothetical protein
LEHSSVAVVVGGRTHELLPGTHKTIEAGGHSYRLTLFDASRALDGSCPAKQEAHVSFALVRTN